MIALGSDHGGYLYKEELKKHLDAKGIEYIDFGTDSTASCDYPVYAEKVCRAIQSGECEKGILICGTGIGMSICANKFKGIRAACCGDHFSAEFTRKQKPPLQVPLTALELAVIYILSISAKTTAC